jgi:hypothetical protein
VSPGHPGNSNESASVCGSQGIEAPIDIKLSAYFGCHDLEKKYLPRLVDSFFFIFVARAEFANLTDVFRVSIRFMLMKV